MFYLSILWQLVSFCFFNLPQMKPVWPKGCWQKNTKNRSFVRDRIWWIGWMLSLLRGLEKFEDLWYPPLVLPLEWRHPCTPCTKHTHRCQAQLEIHKLQPKDIYLSHFVVAGGWRRNPAVSRRTGYAIRKCQAGGQYLQLYTSQLVMVAWNSTHAHAR